MKVNKLISLIVFSRGYSMSANVN